MLKAIYLISVFLIYQEYFQASHSERPENYSVKLTGVYCVDIDKTYIRNASCYLKAARGKLGLLYLHWEYVNVTRLSACYKVFYKNSGGHFLPYILNVCADLCTYKEFLPNSNLMFQRWIQYIVNNDEPVKKGCPVNGHMNYVAHEFDSVASTILPVFLPAGEFYYNALHFDTLTKKTLVSVKVYVTIKAKKGLDLSMLNMG